MTMKKFYKMLKIFIKHYFNSDVKFYDEISYYNIRQIRVTDEEYMYTLKYTKNDRSVSFNMINLNNGEMVASYYNNFDDFKEEIKNYEKENN